MKNKVLGIFLVLSMVAISAEKSVETKIQNENNLIKKVEKNELAIDAIKKQYRVDLKEIENKYREKENILKEKLIDIENEKEKIKLEKDEIIRNFNSLHSFLNRLRDYSFLGIIVFILSVVGYLRSLFKSIDKKIKEGIITKISDLTEIEKKDLIEILVRKNEEMKLKRTKKICILSVDNENKGEIKKILKGFDCREYKSIDDNINFNAYDLILINHNADFNIEKINKMITDNKDSYFFYYGSGRVNSSNMKKNYCNSIFTLHGNLIDLLRTQDVLKK